MFVRDVRDIFLSCSFGGGHSIRGVGKLKMPRDKSGLPLLKCPPCSKHLTLAHIPSHPVSILACPYNDGLYISHILLAITGYYNSLPL